MLTVLVRGGAIVALYDNLRLDPDGYGSIAEALAATGTYGFLPSDGQASEPTAYRPPVYPLLLTLTVANSQVRQAAVAGLHFLFGVATVVLTYSLARRWQLGRWSVLAAVLVTCDPLLLNWSTYVMTETIATLLAVFALLLLTLYSEQGGPVRAGAAGGALALAALCRPAFLFWMVLVLLAMLVQNIRSRTWLDFAIAMTTAAVVLLPWTARNYRVFQHPILVTTHGGYTLLLGNNRYFYRYLREGSWNRPWSGAMFHSAWRAQSAGLGEVAADQEAYQLAFREIRREPVWFAVSCAVRVGRLWSPLPRSPADSPSPAGQAARSSVAFWYVSVYALAMISLISQRQQLLAAPWHWGVLLLIATTSVHTLYWSNMRMRAPLVPLIAVLAAAGAARICTSICRRKSFE